MTQRDYILRHLKDGLSISSAECFSEYGFVDLQSVIRDLRKLGYDIQDNWVHKHNRYGDPVKFKRYFLQMDDRPLNLFETLRA